MNKNTSRYKKVANKEYKSTIERIVYALQMAENELLETKARNGEDVIISDASGEIKSIPASYFIKH